VETAYTPGRPDPLRKLHIVYLWIFRETQIVGNNQAWFPQSNQIQ